MNRSIKYSENHHQYTISLSFPGEHRNYVRQVDYALSQKINKQKIFFDERFEAMISGLNSDDILQKIYHDNSELIIVFVSQYYKSKGWCCNVEWRAIRDLIYTNNSEKIYLLRFDNTQLPGTYSSDIILDISKKNPQEVAQLILDRLKFIRNNHQKKRTIKRKKPKVKLEDQCVQNYLKHIVEINIIPPSRLDSSISPPIIENDFQTIYFRSLSATNTGRGEIIQFKDVLKLLTEQSTRVLVFGESGVGKTTLARLICRHFALNKASKIVPIYLPVRAWRETIGEDINTMHDKALNHFIPTLGYKLVELPKVCKKVGCKLVIIVDGLNECTLTQKTIIYHSTLRLTRGINEVSVLMTTRRVAFSRDEFECEDSSFYMYELCPWTDEQVSKYWTANGLDLNKLQRLQKEILLAMRLPLFARMSVREHLYGLNSSQSPSTILDLFQSFIKRAIEDFSRRVQSSSSSMVTEKVREVLQKLAFFMTSHSLIEIIGSEINQFANTLNIETKDMIYALIENDLLRLAQEPILIENLTNDDASRLYIMFSHQAIQELLTAEYIAFSYNSAMSFSKIIDSNNLTNSFNASEHAFWREIPIYVTSLLLGMKENHFDKARSFIQGFILEKDYLTAARAATKLLEPDADDIRKIITKQLLTEISNQDSYTKCKETFWELGEYGRNTLLNEITQSDGFIKIIARPEFHLHPTNEIKKLKDMFHGEEDVIEKEWRRFGRAVTILGELREERLIEILRRRLTRIRSLHLLYHCLESFLLLIRDPIIGSVNTTILNDPLVPSKWMEHKDPIVATYATLLNSDNQEPEIREKISKRLITFLKAKSNPNNKEFASEFWQRAHGHIVVQEISKWSDGFNIACDALKNECNAPASIYLGFPVHQAVISAITTGLARRQRREKLDFTKLYNFFEIALKNIRYSEVAWACIQLESLMIAVCSQKDRNFISGYLNYWKSKQNKPFVQLLTNVLHTIDNLPF